MFSSSFITHIYQTLCILFHYTCWRYKSNRFCLQWDSLFFCEQKNEVFWVWDSLTHESKAKSQVPPCRLCHLSQILLAPRQPAPSPLAMLPPPSWPLSSCPIFKFLTYSLNLLASVPLHALACHLRNMAQTHFTISAQFWLPMPCGHSCLVQLLEVNLCFQLNRTRVQSTPWEQWEEAALSSKALLRWWQNGVSEDEQDGKGRREHPKQSTELISEEK